MLRIIAASLAVAVALLAVPAVSQSDSGEITIVVTDAATKQPIGLARVLLDGAVITSELTGANGNVKFTDVPDGIYRARSSNAATRVLRRLVRSARRAARQRRGRVGPDTGGSKSSAPSASKHRR